MITQGHTFDYWYCFRDRRVRITIKHFRSSGAWMMERCFYGKYTTGYGSSFREARAHLKRKIRDTKAGTA